jgi:hypothetical protein
MSDWRFTAYDLRSGEKLTDLQVESWQSSDVLSEAGSWSATVNVDGAAASTSTVQSARPLLDDSGDVLLDENSHILVTDPEEYTFATSRRTSVADSTRKGRSLIVAERDGVPVFAGIVWRRRYNAEDRLLEIAGSGLLSYFDHWVPGLSVTYTAQDQFAIVRALVARVQAAAGGDIGLDVTASNSGVNRDRTYPRYDGSTFGELIMNLSRVSNGFDLAGRVEYNAGAVERWVRLWYPRRGRDISATNLQFRAPGNAVLFDMAEDATDMAVTVNALGAGDGPDMLIAPASQTDLIDAGWPGYTTTRAYKDVTDYTTLDAHARADVDRLSGIDSEEYRVRVDPTDVSRPWGSWDLGDDAVLIVEDDPMYPANDDGTPGLVTLRRVVTHDWSVTDSSEELFVTLARKVIP